MPNSTVYVVVRAKGGSFRFTQMKGLISVTYDEPDIITLDDSRAPRAKMQCGQVIS